MRSSPGPETGCSALPVVDAPVGAPVAILTRSGDRVQQLVVGPHGARSNWLRSSPGPETGCSVTTSRGSTARAGRCDPHPVRRPGAATWQDGVDALDSTLRSSPGPETGCSTPWRRSIPSSSAVLRSSPGPETGCSLSTTDLSSPALLLRSSPGPETGCSYAVVVDVRPQADVAILTRSGDRVQLAFLLACNLQIASCDPHPVRRPGAALHKPYVVHQFDKVAILTRSGDRVQPRPRSCRGSP